MEPHLSDACLTASCDRTAASNTLFRVYPRVLGRPVAMDPAPRRMVDEPGLSRRAEVIAKAAMLDVCGLEAVFAELRRSYSSIRDPEQSAFSVFKFNSVRVRKGSYTRVGFNTRVQLHVSVLASM